jgi:hypothetical protein
MSPKPSVLWALLALCLATAFVAIAYPMYVLRPFRAQGAAELAAALEVRRWGPAAAAVGVAVALACAIALWRISRRRVWRIAALSLTALTALFAILSHVNIFELMFHRVDSPVTIAANKAKLETDDMVLAIRVGNEVRAYPVRMMGYHHIVNDTVGGLPVVATY